MSQPDTRATSQAGPRGRADALSGAEALEVVELCMIARADLGMARDFLRAGMKPADVLAELSERGRNDRRVELDGGGCECPEAPAAVWIN